MFVAAEEFPLPLRVPLVRRSRTSLRRPPADIAERTIVFLDCGNIDRNPVEASAARGRCTSSTSTTTTTTRASATSTWSSQDASCTAEIVWDLARALGVAADRADRRGALRRPDHRHRPVHVREHRPARPPDGRRPDRGRGRRHTTIYRRLYEGWPESQAARCSPARCRAIERHDDGALDDDAR